MTAYTENEKRACCSESNIKSNNCHEQIKKRKLVILTEENCPLCSTYPKLDFLAYLPSGDATLTRRAKKYSKITVEVSWGFKHQDQNWGQGILVEPKALEKAVMECEADKDIRAKRREKARERRAVISYLTAKPEF